MFFLCLHFLDCRWSRYSGAFQPRVSRHVAATQTVWYLYLRGVQGSSTMLLSLLQLGLYCLNPRRQPPLPFSSSTSSSFSSSQPPCALCGRMLSHFTSLCTQQCHTPLSPPDYSHRCSF